MASALKETPLPAGEMQHSFLPCFYASTETQPPKGQATVGHLWESCNAKALAERLFLAVFTYFLATVTAWPAFLCNKP